MGRQQSLIDINIAALQDGMHLLSLFSVAQYSQGFKPAFQSDIGTHFRHVLEHYRCFFLQLAEKEFRYDLRARDERLATDLNYAKETIAETISRLESFDFNYFSGNYTIGEKQIDGKQEGHLINEIETNLERELLFLQSHTIHHYAMIAAMARAIGLQPDTGFGVAIPTRNFTRQLDQQAESNKTQG